VWGVFQWFSAGIVLGMVYQISGSIALVALLHTGIDAVAALTPLVAVPAPEWIGMLIFAGIIILLTTKWLMKRSS